MDLKAETIGLAVAMELPLVVIDVQRAGPSTGMPTKTEAADLLAALYGRHGESPLPVVAPCTPSRLLPRGDRGGADRGPPPHAGDPALGHVPRQLLRALAAAGRALPARHRPRLRHRAEPGRRASCPTCATSCSPGRGPCPAPRACATGSAGSRRRTGPATSPTQPENHDHMTRLRAERVARVEVPELEVDDPDGRATLLVLGWGSSYGAIQGARPARPARAGRERRHSAHPPPQPAAAATSARCCAPTSACWCRR